MKTKRLLVNWVLFLTGLLLLVSCTTTPPVEDEPYYGTWANEERIGWGKYVNSPDGKGLFYRSATDSEPMMEARYTIEEKWTGEDGYVYYKVASMASSIPYDESSAAPWYSLNRIDPSGDVLEFVASQNTYPGEIKSGAGYMYKILYRQ